ncbi:nuclear transport factor 2 family protein [Zobellella sp. DQSA1]|uniref:nuclear transport factor 2 family protein n=1 Tax=Zobellella sp. DQSA1 TaxID=3342386 RepID=UPI0035BFD21E
MDYPSLFVRCLREVIANPDFDPDRLPRYFTPDYRQRVNGRQLDYPAFEAHIRTLKRELVRCELHFDRLLCQGTTLVSSHRVQACKADGRRLEVQVMGIFTFEGSRLTTADELTCLLSGDEADGDIGHRH